MLHTVDYFWIIMLLVVLNLSEMKGDLLDKTPHNVCNHSMFSSLVSQKSQFDAIDYYRHFIGYYLNHKCYNYDKVIEIVQNENVSKSKSFDNENCKFYLNFINHIKMNKKCRICWNDIRLEEKPIDLFIDLYFNLNCSTLNNTRIIFGLGYFKESIDVLKTVSLEYLSENFLYRGDIVFNSDYLIFRICQTFFDKNTDDYYLINNELVFINDRININGFIIFAVAGFLLLVTVLFCGSKYSTI